MKKARRRAAEASRGEEERAAAAAPRPWRHRAHLLGAALVLVFLASHRCATVVSEPRGRFEDPDAQFHAHRVMRTVAEGRLLPPVFDPFENFPDGGRAVWPPLHDATIALLARLGGSTAADPARGMHVAAAFPVIELVLVLAAAAALARKTAGDGGGLLAAWLVATAACLFRRGAFGEIDHNVTEVLGGLLLALLARRLAALESERERVLIPVLWGLGVLLGMGFYAGLVLSSGIVVAGHLAVDLTDEASAGRRSALFSVGYALAACVLPFTASWRVHPDPGDPWRLGPVYVLILAFAAAGNALGSLVAALRFRKLTARTAAPPLASLGASLLVGALQPRAAWGGFLKGLGFIGARDPWLSTIDEFQPLLSTGVAPLLSALPALLVAAVAVALALVALRRRDVAERSPFLVVAVPFLLFVALAFAQKRFLPPAAAFAAVAAGAAWVFVKPRDSFRWAVIASFVAALLLTSTNLLAYCAAAFRNESSPEVSAGEAAGIVLARMSPPPGDPPEWGVLAPWEFGHPILWTSGRAVALNNYGTFHSGFARATKLFLETSPSKALEELKRLRMRYVVAAYPPNLVPSAARSVGEDPQRFFSDGYDPKRVTRYALTADGARTLSVRLHRDDAAPLAADGPEDREALTHFVKIWESPEEAPGPNGEAVPFMKIFEVR